MYFLFPDDFLNNIFSSLAYFILRIQYITYVTYKICVNRLFTLSVRLLVNSMQLAVKVWGGVKSYTFDCAGHRHP